MSDRLLLVSADGHAGAPAHRYREYLDPEHRDAYDDFVIQTRADQQAMYEMRLGGESRRRFLEEWYAETGDGGERGAWDSEYRDKELDADGVAAEVLFPDADASNLAWSSVISAPFGAGLASSNATDGELLFAGSKAHNRWLADFCAESPVRRLGVALVPMPFDVDRAVREIRWAREVGLRGVLIPTKWNQFPSYNDPVYDPVWAACAELGMVVHTHSGGGPSDYSHLETLGPIYSWEVWWWAARPLWALILGGVFERHPGLRYACTENTSFWAADLRRATDDQYHGRSHATRKFGKETFQQGFSMSPSERLDQNCKLGSTLNPHDVALRHEIGVNILMFGADFPHPEGTWPDTRGFLRERFAGVPREEVEAIVGGNALDFYDFDRTALRALADEIGPTVDEVLG
jgi:predicted TIM-barrel fold metal-dependent hydrolase